MPSFSPPPFLMPRVATIGFSDDCRLNLDKDPAFQQ